MDCRTYTTALRVSTAAGKGSAFIIVTLLCRRAGRLHQQIRYTREHSRSLAAAQRLKLNGIEHNTELLWRRVWQ